MFVRISRVRNLGYIQVVESYQEQGQSKQRVLCSLGRLEKGSYEAARWAVRDWKRLGRAKVVLAEIEDRSGPRQAKGYLSRYRRWK
ncbi:hypothetical protein HKBW3S09_00719 [Candidatus Hakubella thermalkaliphila]|uniref:Uncharacterized protein n=1 Tax=Candidatus Hakubella thermalkaliphila TaxID=2754717 RepID=A0A6V8PFW3_9ACTN|nr:hypothetical protein [Bacillota bacterium]GFP23252.1 hypothetical protein HKBW3S09_00719 [Candidatus Hakubella thermalkaliphila]GFP30990.1 hypothetical protein HKBW3S34_01909 [Candidatus Hakubella thermalkaliphila]